MTFFQQIPQVAVCICFDKPVKLLLVFKLFFSHGYGVRILVTRVAVVLVHSKPATTDIFVIMGCIVCMLTYLTLVFY